MTMHSGDYPIITLRCPVVLIRIKYPGFGLFVPLIGTTTAVRLQQARLELDPPQGMILLQVRSRANLQSVNYIKLDIALLRILLDFQERLTIGTLAI